MKAFYLCIAFVAVAFFAALTPEADAHGGALRSRLSSCNGAAFSSCYGAVEVRAPFVRVRAPLRAAARIVTRPVRRVEFIEVAPACYAEPAQIVEYYRAPARLEADCAPCNAGQLRARIIDRY